MGNKSLYAEGHLFVAAVRLLEHQKSAPPLLDDIAEALRMTTEQAGLVGRRLRDAGVLEEVEGAFGARWVVKDYLKLEELPREIEAGQLDDALKKFQSERLKIAQKVESIKEQQASKKRELFAEIEKKLKKSTGKE